MSDTKYTEEQIEWAAPIFGELGNSVVDESPPTRMLEYLLSCGDKIKKDKQKLRASH